MDGNAAIGADGTNGARNRYEQNTGHPLAEEGWRAASPIARKAERGKLPGVPRRVPAFDDASAEHAFFAEVAAGDPGLAARVHECAVEDGVREPGSHGGPTVATPVEALAAHAASAVLPASLFTLELEREKRRADRSGALLSVAILRIDANDDRRVAQAWTLVEDIQREKRDTDVVGELADHRIAVLLPQSDAAGAQRFVARVLARNAPGNLDSQICTYPRDVIDAVLAGDADTLKQHPLAPAISPDRATAGRRLKRALDVAGSACALVLASPVMIGAAVAVALSSRGPIIYRQQRLGLRGKRFVFYKFRTMFVNTDDRIHREYVQSLIGEPHGDGSQATRPWRKLERDPRITRVGHFLRSTSIDELPQLVNVLKGDMSLVGPRPPLAYEVERYQPWQLHRITDAMPGISGPWQVDSRGRASFEDMVRMDIEYARHWSLARDLRIMAKTVKAVLKRTGAG